MENKKIENKQMKNRQTAHKIRSLSLRKLTYSALYLALAMVLPFLTGQIPNIGRMLSPLHIPALLCGFTVGWPWGLAVGFIAPLLRHLIFKMPPMPGALFMAFEMAVYGALSGLLYRLLPKKPWNFYVTLIVSMAAGRVAWGLARSAFALINRESIPFRLILDSTVLSGIPGIVLHIVLIPLLVLTAEKAGLMLNNKPNAK